MNYAVELVFDEIGQKKIDDIRRTLIENGVHDEAVKLNHISIGDYKTDNVESLIDKIKEFKKNIKPFEIKLVSVGTFMTDENVIFLEPIITKELNNIHDEFINYMKDFNGLLNSYYDMDKWMPHCTIAIRLDDKELIRAIEILKKTIELPITVKIDRIDVINYPNNQVYIDKI